jgi:hypothetical protein
MPNNKESIAKLNSMLRPTENLVLELRDDIIILAIAENQCRHSCRILFSQIAVLCE